MLNKDNSIKYNNLKLTIIIICLFFILSVSNIIESYSFLSKLDMYTTNIGFREIIIYVFCGSSNGRTNLLDLFRFSMPYLLVLFITGIYITDLLDNNRNIFYVIRYKNYKRWIKHNFIKLIVIVIKNFTIYYFILITLSLILMHKDTNFYDIFFYLYPYHDNNSSFMELIVIQWMLSISIEILLVFIQFLFGIFFKDTFKNFYVLSSVIFILSFIGKFNCYNPLMLSKHSILNVNIQITPFTTIISCITIILCINLLTSNIIKAALRRGIL